MKVSNNPTPNPYNTPQVDQSKAAAAKQKSAETEGSVIGAGAGQAVGAHKGASIEISDGARLMQEASQVAKSAPNVRQDKVAALKKSIQDGSYQVAASEIADRLVDEHLSSHFGKNSI